MARNTLPVAYLARSGKQLSVPLDPCIVELQGGRRHWGRNGPELVALPLQEFESEEDSDHRVLLD